MFGVSTLGMPEKLLELDSLRNLLFRIGCASSYVMLYRKCKFQNLHLPVLHSPLRPPHMAKPLNSIELPIPDLKHLTRHVLSNMQGALSIGTVPVA